MKTDVSIMLHTMTHMGNFRFFLATVLFFTGCQPKNNYRILKKGQVSASAILEGSNASYNSLEIFISEQDNSQLDSLVLRLPSGLVLQINELTLEAIQEDCHSVTDYSSLYPSRKDNKKIMYVGGYGFEVKAGKITKISASTVTLESTIRLKKLNGGWEANVPAIGKYGERKLYEMPLTHDEIIELFGKPDSVHDAFHL